MIIMLNKILHYKMGKNIKIVLALIVLPALVINVMSYSLQSISEQHLNKKLKQINSIQKCQIDKYNGPETDNMNKADAKSAISYTEINGNTGEIEHHLIKDIDYHYYSNKSVDL